MVPQVRTIEKVVEKIVVMPIKIQEIVGADLHCQATGRRHSAEMNAVVYALTVGPTQASGAARIPSHCAQRNLLTVQDAVWPYTALENANGRHGKPVIRQNASNGRQRLRARDDELDGLASELCGHPIYLYRSSRLPAR